MAEGILTPLAPMYRNRLDQGRHFEAWEEPRLSGTNAVREPSNRRARRCFRLNHRELGAHLLQPARAAFGEPSVD
jgi:hypothetical protein